MSKEFISPREFLKARRPENFSDSIAQQIPELDRSLLEYHLDTLTSRSQEVEFESFARLLAQAEICPNMLPHTGPTGGGDSKVDSETYPVADSLSLTWFVGIGREAARERWAFAFSAMKDWRQKLQSDIAKIAGTNRGYKSAFFITNQFVADRVRSEIEDELTKKHRMDVRVLDRTWILDRIFVGHHETLAISELNLRLAVRMDQRKGPGDVEKENEMAKIEARIKAASEQGRANVALVADCIRTVELARGLELPRFEIEGRLLRAKRVADQQGTKHQRLLAAYQWAWTTFWWFEDYKMFSEQYTEVEKYAVGSQNAYDFELLCNLWSNLQVIMRSGQLTEEEGKSTERTRLLISELERLQSDPARASAALHAEALRLTMDIIRTPPQKSDPLFEKFTDVIMRSESLIGFPLEPLVQLLTEFGDFVGAQPAYDKLHQTIVSVVANRRGEVAAAGLLLQRGSQQLDSGRPYDAISTLGQALTRLYKNESRRDLIEALYFCGNAYERVGLKWAARGTLLTAASVAISDFWTYAEVTTQQAACFDRIKWLEIQLGRLPHALVWHQTSQAVHRVLESKGCNLNGFADKQMQFDGCLAILLLKSKLWALKELSRLPDTLDHAELPMSALALKFALGHEDKLIKEFEDPSERLKFFKELREQPAALDLPDSAELYNQRRLKLEAQLLGCRICVDVDNCSPCVELAESVLAATEALLSTGIEYRFFAYEPTLTINVRKSDFGKWPFNITIADKGGRPYMEITTPDFHPHKLSHDSQKDLKEKVVELLTVILARVFVRDISGEQVRKLFHDELALERAVHFTSSFVTLGNVLGDKPKTNLDSWIFPNARAYPLKRVEPWDTNERTTNSARQIEFKEGTGNPPSELLAHQANHREMQTISLIRESLWNRGGWEGALFWLSYENQAPPLLGLMFRNAEAAKEIFTHLRNELGEIDKHNRLRITIIRGIMKSNPHAYRILIGSNLGADILPDSRLFLMLTRINTMEPTSNKNLDGFLASYNVMKSFYLAPAICQNDSREPEPLENGILKHELIVKNAWEMGRNDIDVCGMRADDDPIIPEGQQQAPILEALEWLKKCNQTYQ